MDKKNGAKVKVLPYAENTRPTTRWQRKRIATNAKEFDI